MNNYFLPTHNLNTKEKKYCRCVLHLIKQNDKQCNQNKQFVNNTNKKCYNPYAVCASTVKNGSRGSKTCFYNFLNKSIPNEEVVKYAYLNYKNINKWGKQNKFGTIYYYVTNKKIDKLRKLVNNWYLDKLSKVKKNKKN
tara:strand:- start:2477 stop:2893 length:417 start_codon:yes stop_codon:yes gene_type:complete